MIFSKHPSLFLLYSFFSYFLHFLSKENFEFSKIRAPNLKIGKKKEIDRKKLKTMDFKEKQEKT